VGCNLIDSGQANKNVNNPGNSGALSAKKRTNVPAAHSYEQPVQTPDNKEDECNTMKHLYIKLKILTSTFLVFEPQELI